MSSRAASRVAPARVTWAAALLAAWLPGAARAAPPAPPLQETAPAPSTAGQDEVDELVARGRAHLAAREVGRALAVLERADELDGGALRSHVWLLRAWIAAGRINDALDEIDRLAAEHAGADVDYLYGMAFAYKAQGYLAQGVTDPSVGMHFQDALESLTRATEADPERYRDAFLALALSAWYASPPELERARTAVETALRYFPTDANAWFQKGRIAFSQYRVLAPDETRAAEADACWSAAFEAFGRCAELADELEPGARGGEARTLLARSHLRRAHLLLWKDEKDRAAEEIAAVAAVDPEGLEYDQARTQLGEGLFLHALEQAAGAYVERHPGREVDATLLWWLGYARYGNQDLAGAEATFLRCVAARPDFANSWFWIAKARYGREDWSGAVEAFVRYYDEHPAGLLAAIRGDVGANLPIVRWLMDKSYRDGDLVGASVLAEMAAETALDDAALWNDLGLFLRRRHDARVEAGEDPRGPELTALAERSLAAYRRGLAVEPGDPGLLNDTGIVLEHYLERDLDEAERLYRRAVERAEELLAGAEASGATPAQQGRWTRVAEDARKNLAELTGRRPGEGE